MNHELYRQLLARRRELSLREEALLATHLSLCVNCRLVATRYRRQDELLRPLAWQRPPMSQRDSILAAVEARKAQPVGPFDRWRRVAWPSLRRIALQTAVALTVAGAIVVNSPLRGAVPGAQARSSFRLPATACNAQGWAFVNYRQILQSPAQYRGSGVVFFRTAVAEARAAIPNAIYYVVPYSTRRLAACQPNAQILDFQIAVDTRHGTALHAVGVAPAYSP